MLLLVSCSSDKHEINNGDYEVLKINPEETHEVYFRELFSRAEFVKLNTPSDNILGKPEKIKIKSNRIYVLDTFQSRGLYVFDINGNYLFSILNHGRGPGEFQEPTDFFIDQKNERIIIYDLSLTRLSFYDLNTGVHLYDEPLPFYIENFSLLDGGYILYKNNMTGGNDYRFVVLDTSDLSIINNQQYINYELRNLHFILSQVFFRNKSNGEEFLIITVPFQNMIYKMDSDDYTLRNYIMVDFGKYNIEEGFFENIRDNQERMKTLHENHAFNITNYYSNDEMMFFTFRFNEEHLFFFNFNHGETPLLTSSSKFLLENTMGPHFNWPMAFYENKFVWVQYKDVLENYLDLYESVMDDAEWKEFQHQKRDLIDLRKSFTDSDNVYLIFAELKSQ